MRIVIIGPAYPYRGGLAAFNERLARELQREHEVTLHTFTLQYPGFLFPGKTQFVEGPGPAGLTILRTINSVNPLSWFSAAADINATQPDLAIIAFWLPFMGPALGTVARRLNCKVVAVVHNAVPHETRIGDIPFTRYFTGGVDGFVALTRSVADDLRGFAPNKPIAVSPHPVYDHYGDPEPTTAPARRRLFLDLEPKYLLFFGLIREYKGLDLLLRALADERLRTLDVRLVVAGEFYGDRAPYDALITELRLEDRVTIRPDFIPDEQVADYFNAADLLVQPYKTATQSGVTQIAYHFELPMVVTDVGGLAEMVPDGRSGYVAAPEPEAIASAIERFFVATNREKMRETLLEERRKYAWSTFAARVLGVGE